MLARGWWIFLLVLAAPGAGRGAEDVGRPEDPCAEDVRQFCSDVKPGSRRVADCLDANRPRLTAACGARLDAARQKAKALILEFGRSCRVDVDRYCPSRRGRTGSPCRPTRAPRQTIGCMGRLVPRWCHALGPVASGAVHSRRLGPRQRTAVPQAFEANWCVTSPRCSFTIGKLQIPFPAPSNPLVRQGVFFYASSVSPTSPGAGAGASSRRTASRRTSGERWA